MKRKILLYCFLFLILGIGVPTLQSTPFGAPSDGRTGSPGDGNKTCVDIGCHSGGPTTVSGIISSNVPVEGYTPGSSYTITVTVDGAGKKGFCVSPQKLDGTILGTLSAGAGNSVTGKGYVTHTSTISSTPAVWTFTWVAPVAGTGTVNFYGAYANNKTAVRKSVVAINEKLASGLTEYSKVEKLKVVPNPISGNVINVSFETTKTQSIILSIFDLKGMEVSNLVNANFQSGNHTESYVIPNLESGIYFLRMQNGEQLVQKKFLVQ